MLTNTASDQDSRAIQVRTGTPSVRIHPAALIAGVAGEGDARPMGHLKTAVEIIEGCAVTWDTSHSRDVVVVLTSSSAKGPRHVSDQPASLREPYTAISAAITATDRLIADGMQWGYLHAASSLTGFTGGGFDSPSTQRPNQAWAVTTDRLRRCVLGRIAREAGIRLQRGRGWGGVRGGEYVDHAATPERVPCGDEEVPDGNTYGKPSSSQARRTIGSGADRRPDL